MRSSNDAPVAAPNGRDVSPLARYAPVGVLGVVVCVLSIVTRALLIAGKPLGEPIAQHGPFVMNTNEEIFQAVRDYQSGKFATSA